METYQSFQNPPSEDVILGMPEGRNLSPVRRFFVLLATFDFLFTVLLWTLCVILVKGGENIIESFTAEVLQFSFKISIFDIVLCSACRFVILLLFYALLQCHHWLPVACTTAASCAFLLVKVFVFGWKDYGSSSPWPVFLVLTSFVIAWAEAWFLDFRVVPLERQAQFYLARQAAISHGQGVLPWLSQNVSQIALNSPMVGGLQSYPESVANFFSPLQSPVHSDEEEESETESMEKKNRRLLKQMNGSPECRMWLQQSPIIADQLVEKIESPGWVRDKTTDCGDTVFSRKTNHKIFKITGFLPATAEKVLFELFHNFEAMPNWSSSVARCEILQKLDPFTDVSYQETNSGGVIAPRDFITLRHHKIEPNGIHILACVSVKHWNKPIQDKIIRGTHGIAGWILTPSSVNPNETNFRWVLDVDLQLQNWIPRGIVDKAMMSAALDTLRCLRGTLTFMPEQVEIGIDVNNVSSRDVRS